MLFLSFGFAAIMTARRRPLGAFGFTTTEYSSVSGFLRFSQFLKYFFDHNSWDYGILYFNPNFLGEFLSSRNQKGSSKFGNQDRHGKVASFCGVFEEGSSFGGVSIEPLGKSGIVTMSFSKYVVENHQGLLLDCTSYF